MIDEGQYLEGNIMNDRLKEDIKFKTEIYRLLWITILGSGGGTVSLIVGGLTPVKVVFAAGGLTGILILIAFMQRLHQDIRGLIAQLEE